MEEPIDGQSCPLDPQVFLNNINNMYKDLQDANRSLEDTSPNKDGGRKKKGGQGVPGPGFIDSIDRYKQKQEKAKQLANDLNAKWQKYFPGIQYVVRGDFIPHVELTTDHTFLSFIAKCALSKKQYVGGDDKIKFKRDGKIFTRAVTKCVKIDGKYVPINKL